MFAGWETGKFKFTDLLTIDDVILASQLNSLSLGYKEEAYFGNLPKCRNQGRGVTEKEGADPFVNTSEGSSKFKIIIDLTKLRNKSIIDYLTKA